ncbi:MAG TPA: hypothetical protein VN429_05240, partial [Methanospirillum sp.]|uniref:hypothetical protein n=1 Tax=Methanospirillum sp. TaxID=45200 RepID=UPI002BCA5EA9
SDTTASITISQSSSSISGISSSKVVSYTPSGENAAQTSSSVPQNIAEKPPERWLQDTKTGMFYDPVSRTYWRYDSVIRKFTNKEKGWYLITRFSETQPGRIIGQYYYDPHSVSLIDIDTGESINPSTMETVQSTQTASPTRTVKPTQTPVPQVTDQTDGSGTTGGQSENPQGLVQPVAKVTSQQGGQSETPQVMPQPTQTPTPQGGISETAQAPILAMKMGLTWTNENSDAVTNHPTSPTTISFETDVQVLSISTYHWNNGQGGSVPGTIGLKSSDGTIFGPWKATGENGQGGVPNARWTVVPDSSDGTGQVLKKGSYTIIDSDESTWSANEKSKNQGFCTVEYINAHEISPLKNLSDTSVKPLNFKNINLGDLST